MTAGAAPERAILAGPSGPIEGAVEDVPGEGSHYAVVCHPHPLYGGTMDNKVVTTVSRAFRAAGIPVLRFNFRGVGASKGTFDGGIGETADADAAASWGAVRWPGRQLMVAGFSFGAYVAFRLTQHRGAARLITIAPPVERFDFTALTVPDFPWFIVQGDADDVVDAKRVAAWANGRTPRPHLLMVPGAGHFFHGRLHDLRDVLFGAVRSTDPG